jgi:hypothetical protein
VTSRGWPEGDWLMAVDWESTTVSSSAGAHMGLGKGESLENKLMGQRAAKARKSAVPRR